MTKAGAFWAQGAAWLEAAEAGKMEILRRRIQNEAAIPDPEAEGKSASTIFSDKARVAATVSSSIR